MSRAIPHLPSKRGFLYRPTLSFSSKAQKESKQTRLQTCAADPDSLCISFFSSSQYLMLLIKLRPHALLESVLKSSFACSILYYFCIPPNPRLQPCVRQRSDVAIPVCLWRPTDYQTAYTCREGSYFCCSRTGRHTGDLS